jgi:hypothetical protein
MVTRRFHRHRHARRRTLDGACKHCGDQENRELHRCNYIIATNSLAPSVSLGLIRKYCRWPFHTATSPKLTHGAHPEKIVPRPSSHRGSKRRFTARIDSISLGEYCT